MTLTRRLSVAAMIAAVVFALDQSSKQLILTRWPQARDSLVPIVPTFDLSINWNRGVSFSLGNNLGAYDRFIFLGLAVAVCMGLVWWIVKGVKPVVLAALAMVIGGALGNSWDRLRFGAVEDFLYFHVGSFSWPVFNLADSAICVGAGLMIFDSLFDRSLSHKNNP